MASMAAFPPLVNRVAISRTKARLPVQAPTILRPSSYKHWTDERMNLAYEAYQTSSLSVRRVAEEYGVPKSTLQDRISGRVLHGAKSGKNRYLSDAEEKEFVDFLMQCSQIGFPRTRIDVIRMVQEVCDYRGIDATVTHGWWERFLQRHPELSLRSAANLSRSRVKGSSPAIMKAYCQTLEQTLIQNDLMDKPGQIFNMDESGMPLDPKATKIITKKGTKNPSHVSSGDKSQITVVGCVNAAGISIPPMLLFDRKKLSEDMWYGEVPGTYYGMDSGWMNRELFEDWLVCHFLRYAPPVRPLLLLLDGHSSHYNPTAIQFAVKEKIILFALPPHTSHITQPLDRGCFGPLKTAWRKSCQEYMRNNSGKVITRFSFNRVFAEAYKKAMTMDNIISSFRTTGIYPFDKDKVLDNPLVKEPSSLAEDAGIAYLPLYSSSVPAEQAQSLPSCFSERELVDYHKKYVNEMAVPEEDRYLQWKKVYHPLEEKMSSGSYDSAFLATPSKPSSKCKFAAFPKPHSSIQRMFKAPTETIRPPIDTSNFKKFAHTLTSAENLKLLEEKQKKKDEAERLKKERQEQRELKKKEKEEILRVKQEQKRVKQLKKKVPLKTTSRYSKATTSAGLLLYIILATCSK